MSLKKKLGMGIITGAIGLSLIAGGTWAAFNDVERVNNTFASGTLDLGIGEGEYLFKLSNMKPGDSRTEELTLTNDGSLHINQIFLRTAYVDGWEDLDIIDLETKIGSGAGENNLEDFLGQFQVKITRQDTGEVVYGEVGDKRLSDLIVDVNDEADAELTGTDDTTIGLAAGADPIVYEFYIEFVEDGETFPGSRLQVQNKYQGEGANLNFLFEATQMPGEER